MLPSKLPGHCDVISNRLWRHQQNANRANETRGRYVKIVIFIVIYGFVMSYKKKKWCLYSSGKLTGGNRAKLWSSRWHRRGRSLREVFACSRLFATTDLSQICNRITWGHGTPCTKTTDSYPLWFLYNNLRKIRRETTVGENPGRR